MPRTKSAKKALRTSEKKRGNNLKIKTQFKSLIKKMRGQAKKEDWQKVSALLDKAANKKVIHKNKAGRLKSRLWQLLGKEKGTIRQKAGKIKRKAKPKTKRKTKK